MTSLLLPLDTVAPAATALVVHASESWSSAIARGDFDFFEKLAHHARAQGSRTYLVAAESRESAIVLQGHRRNIMVGPRQATNDTALFAMPSYVWGFWYLDPMGINWHSSLKDQSFRADDIDADQARFFFNGVSGYMRRENRSKFPQADAPPEPLAPARAVIYLQDIERYKTPVHDLTSDQMIRITAAATRDRVYVKPHPMQSPQDLARLSRWVRHFDNVTLTDRSIHDLTAVSDIVITQNSAAGFEALMHRKPVITCASTDYHHATRVVRTAGQLREAVADAPDRMAGFPFDKYFYWFLGLNMLEPQKPDFATRAWARIAAL